MNIVNGPFFVKSFVKQELENTLFFSFQNPVRISRIVFLLTFSDARLIENKRMWEDVIEEIINEKNDLGRLKMVIEVSFTFLNIIGCRKARKWKTRKETIKIEQMRQSCEFSITLKFMRSSYQGRKLMRTIVVKIFIEKTR